MSNVRAQLLKMKAEVESKYGPNAVMLASEIPKRAPISSGSLALDFAIGIGGMPADRVVEVSGSDGCGKTTLGLLTMASFLKEQPDRYGVILDIEHKMTPDWMAQLVDPELIDTRILYARPTYMEQATNMYLDTVSSGQVCMVLLDSIGGAPSMASTVKDAEKGEVGGNAQSVTRFGRLAATFSDTHHCLTFCTNQVRDDMEGFRRHMTPGGKGFKHACILRIKLRKSTTDKVEAVVGGEKMVVGHKIHAQIIKNQLAPEGRKAEWWMYNVPTEEYGFGIDTLDEVIRLAAVTGVIVQRGSMYDHAALPGGTVKGRAALAEAIRNDESLKDTIVSETMAVLRDDVSLVAPIDPETPVEGDA